MIIRPLFLFLLLTISPLVLSAEIDSLFSAAGQGKIERVKSLLSNGLDVNGTTAAGRTAMMGACFNGNIRVAKILLSYGADVNLADNLGTTALMDAVIFGNAELVKLIISAGATIDTVDKKGLSAIDKVKMTAFTNLLKILENSQSTQKKKASDSATQPKGNDGQADDKNKSTK